MSKLFFSNSSCRVWADCPRKFYWQMCALGTGLATPFVDEDLLYGADLHEILPDLWSGDVTSGVIHSRRIEVETQLLGDPNWEKSLPMELRVEKAHEWGRLFEAHCYVLLRHTLPMLRKQYRLVQAEVSQIKWMTPEAALLAKPDTLLEPLDGSPEITYLEWKTAAGFTKEWASQWHNNPQSWTGAITARETRQDIALFRVCGILKGSESSSEVNGTKVSYRNSPLLWAYRQERGVEQKRALKIDQTKVEARGETWSYAGTTAKGWTCVSTDEFPGGVGAWIAALPQDVISEQTTVTDPFVIDWELAEEWWANQRPMVEAVHDLRWKESNGSPQEVLDQTLRKRFPRQFHMCNAGRYGKACAMKEVCHNPIAGARPLDYGYIKRVSHHDLEREMQAKEGA